MSADPPDPAPPVELDRVLSRIALPRPDPLALARVHSQLQARLARRRRWAGVAGVWLPIAGAAALTAPWWARKPYLQTPRQGAAESAVAEVVALQPSEFLSEGPGLGPGRSPAERGPALPPAGTVIAPSVRAASTARTSAASAPPRRRQSAAPAAAASATAAPAPPLAPAPDRAALPLNPPLSDETRRLSRAIAQLRQQGDPQGALATLDGYLRTFAAPHFGPEARFFRVQALVALGRGEAALAELAPGRFEELPRHDELSVLRGELLLELGRPVEARAAFDAAVEALHDDGLLERALVGRAAASRAMRSVR